MIFALISKWDFKVERDKNTRILSVQACGISEQALGGTDGPIRVSCKKTRELKAAEEEIFQLRTKIIRGQFNKTFTSVIYN